MNGNDLVCDSERRRSVALYLIKGEHGYVVTNGRYLDTAGAKFWAFGTIDAALGFLRERMVNDSTRGE